MKTALLILVSFLIGNTYAFAETPDIREGLWEMSMSTEIASKPTSMPSIAYTTQQCMTKKTAADPYTLLQNQHCALSDVQIQSNKLTWKMQCQQQNVSMNGEGSANYQEESFTGEFSMTMQSTDAAALTMISKISGRYLKDCP